MINSGVSSSASLSSLANDSYTDLTSVHAIRDIAKSDKNKAVTEISKQFESMMIRMMLKSMREANDVFSKGNYLTSHEGDTYQQMYDDQLALSLSSGRGMGIAEIMAKQLNTRFVGNPTPTADNGSVSLESYARTKFTNDNSTNHGYQKSVSIDNYTTKESNNAQQNKIDEGVANSPAKTLPFDGDIKSFVQVIHPFAENAAKKLGVNADVLIAQSALETGWGAKITSSKSSGSEDITSSFNLFNIKADQRWSGKTVVVPTMEVRQGVPNKEYAAFRSYNSIEESFNDYVAFIRNSPRYEQAVASKNDESYIRGISKAGYATDPNYAEKILKIADSKALKIAINDVANNRTDEK